MSRDIKTTHASHEMLSSSPVSGGTMITEGDEVESDYVFLCGVMWCRYGQEEAGRELLRATLSKDPDISTLAWAMFAKGKTGQTCGSEATTDS